MGKHENLKPPNEACMPRQADDLHNGISLMGYWGSMIPAKPRLSWKWPIMEKIYFEAI